MNYFVEWEGGGGGLLGLALTCTKHIFLLISFTLDGLCNIQFFLLVVYL